jgi:hypothetical protein
MSWELLLSPQGCYAAFIALCAIAIGYHFGGIVLHPLSWILGWVRDLLAIIGVVAIAIVVFLIRHQSSMFVAGVHKVVAALGDSVGRSS